MTAVQRLAVSLLYLLLICLLLSSCSGTITSSLIGPAFENMKQQPDIELVCEGSPSYLLMLDSLIAGETDSEELLEQGVKAYGGFIGAMSECGASPKRISAMADKAHRYSRMLMEKRLALNPKDSFDTFSKKVAALSQSDAGPLFSAAFGWIVWIQQQQGAPAAMAGLAKIEKMLSRVIELDESIEDGSAHFLLGAYHGSRPEILGGNLQKSRFHFERALQLSERKVLVFQTVFAETYCRVGMDRQLHNALLSEVSDFPLQASPENTLTNQIAKRKAARLLQQNFFDE